MLVEKVALVAETETQLARVVLTQQAVAEQGSRHLARTADVGACKPCMDLAGEYDAPFPVDVWYTHPRCRCSWSSSRGTTKMTRVLRALPALKMAPGSEVDVVGLLLPFGGPFNGVDLAGEKFTKATDFCLDWYQADRPLLFQHGLDKDAGTSPIGRIKAIEMKADGGWMQAQLDASSEYFGAIKELIARGSVGLSSGAMAHLVEVDKKSGSITRWPVVEGSITPTPCNPMAVVELDAAKAHFKSAGLDADALKAVWSAKQQDQLNDAAFLYIEPGGETTDGKTTPRSLRHFPVRDADGTLDDAPVRNVLARIPQSTLPQAVKDAALAKAHKYAKSLGIDVSEDGTKAVDLSGVCTQCLADNEAGCLCAPCVDGNPAACLCDGATYGAVPEPDTSEPEALSLGGCFEDRIQDVRAAVNQSGPLASYVYNEVLATFDDYVLVCRHDYSDDGPGDQTYWQIPYTMTNDEPLLDMSRAIQLDQVYLPADTKTAPIALSLDAHALSTHATALTARTKGVRDARLKEGRVLSVANRTQIATAIRSMQETATALQDLLDTTEKTAEASAKAAYLASPEARARELELLMLVV